MQDTNEPEECDVGELATSILATFFLECPEALQYARENEDADGFAGGLLAALCEWMAEEADVLRDTPAAGMIAQFAFEFFEFADFYQLARLLKATKPKRSRKPTLVQACLH